MKFCPTCQTRYDEEILRFCTKDGTPLIDENQPNFKEMPSDSVASVEEPDFGEETVVRYKPPKDILPAEPEPQPDIERSEAPRIVISTSEQEKQQVRARQIPPYQPLEPPKPNTGKVVMLTILGTLAVLAMALGLFVFLRDDEPANINFNVNTNPPDTNLNTNLNYGASNFNFNANTNLNYNVNTNFNLPSLNLNTNFNVNRPTPSPTRTPSPTPSPTPSDENTNTNTITNSAPPATPRPTVTATPRPSSPTPNRTPGSSPSTPTARPANNSDDPR